MKAMDMKRFVKKILKPVDVADGPIVRFIAAVKEGPYGAEVMFDTGETFSLNSTNTLKLIEAFGSDSNLWPGMKVELREGETTNPKTREPVKTILLAPMSTSGLSDSEKAAQALAGTRNADIAEDIPF
jgi:hypothetical protein